MNNRTKRLRPAQIEADRASFAALQGVVDYSPANPAYSTGAITRMYEEMQSAQRAEAQAEAALAAARDNAVAKEWAFHDSVLGSKDQVVAQFGRNSNEVQALGLKKASEYKAPQRKPRPAAT